MPDVYRFFLGKPFADTLEVTGQDAHHMGHVLRMKVGDEFQIVSLDQIAAVMKITAFSKDAVTLETVRILEENHEPTVRVTLYQGLPKQDKMEWIIQKAIELGISEIQPVSMAHCVVRLDELPKSWSAGKRLLRQRPSKASGISSLLSRPLCR